jgi:hypothetical protein
MSNDENATTLASLAYCLDQLWFPMKHLDIPLSDNDDLEPYQEAVGYLADVLEGHVETIMSDEHVRQAISNVMLKGGNPCPKSK